MGPRRKPGAPTYSQLFHDGIGTSSSGPSSSEAVPDSQTSQRRAQNERRAALGMPIWNPEDADPDRSQPSTATDYFDNM
ncbi:hypothetical protein IGI04_019579 [Brassica rapa subsp. trilocularis]|uniref:Uncharacterized protein n=1 Tax=Brassica rapa subsp. trilocularis TaxID=1813537 RepID=A0ABQ7MIM2_BRACM|nr:hypothetical protein IGI04_019579 [Brassica rapa subsp. trilocularis]